MPRLREVPRSEAGPLATKMYDLMFGDRDPVASPGTDSGTRGDWWTVFALVPDVLDHAVRGFGLYQSPQRLLDPKLRELGQTRAGWLRGSRFVYTQHCKSMRDAGFTEEQILALPSWPEASCFDPAQRAVLAYTDELVGGNGRVTDATFDTLRAHLSDEQILELTYITALYEMHAIISRALRLESDDVEPDAPTLGGVSG